MVIFKIKIFFQNIFSTETQKWGICWLVTFWLCDFQEKPRMIIDLIDINLPQCMMVAYWGVSNDHLPEGLDFITRERMPRVIK